MCSSAGQVLPDPGELLRRDDVGHVELAGSVLAELGARVVGMEEAHAIEPGARIVPVVGVAPHADVRSDDPLLEYEGAVAHEPSWLGKPLAVGGERG